MLEKPVLRKHQFSSTRY